MGRTQLNIRLGENQKERWREHAEESRYVDHITDLVKRAVEDQIDRDTSGATPSSQGGSRGEAPGEVLDRIQELRNDIHDLESEVSQALDAVHGQEGMDPDLPPEVHAALPLGEENAVTVEELVGDGSRGFSEAQARFTLENLVRNMGDVHRTPEELPGSHPDTEVRWYKEE